MSIQSEIERLETARDTIRDKFVEFGISSSTDKLDALASAAEGIVNNGEINEQLDALAESSIIIPCGYTNGGTVTLSESLGQVEQDIASAITEKGGSVSGGLSTFAAAIRNISSAPYSMEIVSYTNNSAYYVPINTFCIFVSLTPTAMTVANSYYMVLIFKNSNGTYNYTRATSDYAISSTNYPSSNGAPISTGGFKFVAGNYLLIHD